VVDYGRHGVGLSLRKDFMSSELFLEDLRRIGAVITGSHIVYTSLKHGSDYVNKDALYPHVELTAQLCREMARPFQDDGIEVVIAPATGGIVLTQWIAMHLTEMMKLTERGLPPVFAVYVEREDATLIKASKPSTYSLVRSDVKLAGGRSTGVEGPLSFDTLKGDELVIRTTRFVFKRGYRKLVAGKRALIAEDVLNTGGSALATVLASREAGADVVGATVLCNRGGVTATDLGVPKLHALIDITLDAWEEKDCPLCKDKVPVNKEVGKGRQFLESQGRP
jgi:orotate phosphoribosyltransferase